MQWKRPLDADFWRSIAALPKSFSGRQSAMAVWNGSAVLIFGGYSPGDTLEVVGLHSDSARFDPSTGVVYFYVKQ